VIRTWGDPWQSTYTDGPVQSFTAKTGIGVEFDVTDYLEIQTKVRQSLAAGQRPPVDVVLTIESAAYAAAAQEISVPLDPSIVTNLAALTSVGRPADGSTSYANPTSYSQPIVYATDRVTMPASISWEEIWDPKYEGRLFVTSTPQSLLLPTAKLLGIDIATDDLTPVWDKIAELQPNIAAAGDEEEFISGVQRGEFDLGITLAAVAVDVEGVRWIVPTEGTALSFESFFVPQGLPEDVTYWAQVLVNEALSADAGTALTVGLNEVSTNPDAQLPASMQGDPAFPFSQEDIDKYALVVDPALFARNQDQWQAAYSAAITG
jgi:spermidine/putrescine-binding protein